MVARSITSGVEAVQTSSCRDRATPSTARSTPLISEMVMAVWTLLWTSSSLPLRVSVEGSQESRSDMKLRSSATSLFTTSTFTSTVLEYIVET